MKKLLTTIFIFLTIPLISQAAYVTVPQSTAYGQVLIGNLAGGNYTPVATSTLNIANTSTFGTTSISALFPLSWSTLLAQMTFGGLSTSTNLTQGYIPYVTSANTFGQVSTTTVTCSGATSCSLFTIIGSSPITISSSVSWSTTSQSYWASQFNQFYEINGYLTPTSTIPVLFNASTTLQNYTGLNATTTAATTTALSVTQNFMTIGGNYINGTSTPSFNLASSTLDAMGHSYSVGTSTFLLRNSPTSIKVLGVYCVASTSGTVLVDLSHDNGNVTNTITCSSGSYTQLSTNNTWTAFEDFNAQASSTFGTIPSRITVTPMIINTSN